MEEIKITTPQKPTSMDHNQFDKMLQHKSVCQELTELYVKKNNDYGNSFADTFHELGMVSAVSRIVDKVNRLKFLCINPAKVKDESLRDTLIDTANYCIMTLMEMED